MKKNGTKDFKCLCCKKFFFTADKAEEHAKDSHTIKDFYICRVKGCLNTVNPTGEDHKCDFVVPAPPPPAPEPLGRFDAGQKLRGRKLRY